MSSPQQSLTVTILTILLAVLMLIFITSCDGQSSQETGNNESTTETITEPPVNSESHSDIEVSSPVTETEKASTTETATTAVEDVNPEGSEKAVPIAADETPESVSHGIDAGNLYNVVDGNKLDSFSYEGFKLYRNWCARCHGTYGQGMVGPNLAESLNVISKDEFIEVVTYGKTGQIGSMPAWESNASVMNGMDNLYAYLKARADGAIGEVKPSRQ